MNSPQDPSMPRFTKKAFALYGWTHVLAGVAALALIAGLATRFGSDVMTWVTYVSLAGVAVTAIIFGVLAIRSRGIIAYGDPREPVLTLVRAYAALLLALGAMMVIADAASDSPLGLVGAGILWILAAILGLNAVRGLHDSGTSPHTAATAMGVVAAVLFLIGHAAAGPIQGTPPQHWSAISSVFTGIGVLGGVAVLVGAIGTAATSASSKDAPPPWQRLGIPLAVVLLAVATLIPATQFLMNFQWSLLTTPQDLFTQEPILGASLLIFLVTFILLTVGAVYAMLAGGIAGAIALGDMEWSRLRDNVSTIVARRAKPAKPTNQRLTCPKCKSTATLTAGERPVCPKCWYSGPT